MTDSRKEAVTSAVVLAIHIGDMHVRAAWKDVLNAPTRMEDGDEFQRYCTPSLITLDKGGAQLGYLAQMAASGGGAKPLIWRYSRSGLQERTFVARDGMGRGLTASAFTALTARRLVGESGAWLSAPPDVVLVVPDKLGPAARLGLAKLVAEATQRPTSVCGEDQALAVGLGLAERGMGLIVSIDDDALRLRIVDMAGKGASPLASQTIPRLGIQALKDAWLSGWNRDAKDLLPGIELFSDPESAEFERIWQDIWQCLDTDPRLNARMPAWTLVRGSTVVPLVFPLSVAVAEIRTIAADVLERLGQFLTEVNFKVQSLSSVVVVAPVGLGRVIAKSLSNELGVEEAVVRTFDASIYSKGAVKRRLFDKDLGFDTLVVAPCMLGALGAPKEEGGVLLKPLIEAGASLPASASFSVMANRDVQRRLTVKLAQQKNGEKPALCHLTEFGPLQGQGMLRVKVNVTWDPDGRINANAVDAETEIALPVLDDCDVVPAGPVLGAQHIFQLE